MHDKPKNLILSEFIGRFHDLDKRGEEPVCTVAAQVMPSGLVPRAVIWRTAVPKMSLLDTLLITQ
jgi:hypothetical protein